ncbi:uncharacterized protein LY89DRAFT_786552 [Mollisia scopiformis]|uniref:Uncharacterized protein n=1 Tax=Mollisia scopiformis TaxID=149040 RepID=A0A194WVH6_MOLSC|nr:uncharacterized protein LY89DRAFT_786552 [Mollisia scopiformis]KUJ11669.1 hypothetical protein LY89DRAFT_786552 [Mollisia scopiformis]
MEVPFSEPRHITIFTVAAGTPSALTDMKLGRFIPTSAVDHWGIYIESADDYETHNGLCIELDRSEDGGIIARDRTRREREEKEPQKGIKYDFTQKFTAWEDRRIIQCAKDICKDQMYSTYHVIKGNCQTLVNLLVQRIASGDLYIPKSTASHIFSKGPSNANLVGIWEADMVPSERLRLMAKTRAASKVPWNTNQLEAPGEASFTLVQSAMGPLWNISQVKNRDDPLTLEEQRLNAYYLSNLIDGAVEPVQEQSLRTGRSPGLRSDIDIKERIKAAEMSVKNSLEETFRRSRGMSTLGASLAVYDDPKIPLERREEMRKRLTDLNSRYLRSKRAALLDQTRQLPRLYLGKDTVRREDITSEQTRQQLELWLKNDEQDNNPEIVDKGPSQVSGPKESR